MEYSIESSENSQAEIAAEIAGKRLWSTRIEIGQKRYVVRGTLEAERTRLVDALFSTVVVWPRAARDVFVDLRDGSTAWNVKLPDVEVWDAPYLERIDLAYDGGDLVVYRWRKGGWGFYEVYYRRDQSPRDWRMFVVTESQDLAQAWVAFLAAVRREAKPGPIVRPDWPMPPLPA